AQAKELYDAHKYSEAVRLFNRIIERSSDNATALKGRGICYQALNNYKAAIDDFSRCLSKNRSDVDCLERRSYCYFNSGQRDKAMLDARAIVNLKPNDPESYDRLGSILESTDLNRAIEVHKKGIAVDPGYANGYARLAHCFLRSGQPSSAIEYATKALSLDPKCGGAYTAMAIACRDVASVKRGIAICTKGIK